MNRRFAYRLILPDGQQAELAIELDGDSLDCRLPAPVAREWTALDTHRCPHCPLNPTTTPLCPLAARLEPLVDLLGSLLSYDRVTVAMQSGERTVTAATSAQAAASSIMGLISATSGCPHTAFLKPLAWFHQPFATEEETTFRAAAAYLLTQYFRQDSESGVQPDWRLTGMMRRYEALHAVNVGIAKRLRMACPKDAAVNAIIRLDMFAKSVLLDQTLDELRPLFAPTPKNAP
ncbi:DUF6901 family protein [Methyloterricola oryzae]|uniref:DUF6901 family protein n=1 Tax=Methyloterricola oryzae TaxID=1495050 RepID=UPI0005EBB02E|nr:hypothetical protein [Methyloterricola oryzae]